MLDQNTDRMWMVIGSVVVGALLIGLLRTFAPDMMDLVTTEFENMLNETDATAVPTINLFGSIPFF